MQRLALCFALAALVACHEDEPPPTVALSIDPTTIMSGGTTRLRVTVENFELIEEGHAHDASTDEHTHEGDVPRQGHYHIYLDTTEENPLLMSAAAEADLMITAAPGEHKLIARLSDLEHRTITPEVRDEATITITDASGSGGGGSGGSAGGSGGSGGSGGN
jgi:hypothetical protein